MRAQHGMSKDMFFFQQHNREGSPMEQVLLTEGFDSSCSFIDVKGDTGLMQEYAQHDTSHACSHN